MKPIDFKNRNKILKAPNGSDDVKDLPVLYIEAPNLDYGDYTYNIVSCWKINIWDRLKLLFTGVVWLNVHHSGQPPVSLHVKKPFEMKTIVKED